MKRMLIILTLTGLAFSVSAQKFYGRGYYARPRVVISTGFYSPFYPYGYFSPYYAFGYPIPPMRETRLELRLENIRNDYRDRIWSARHDKTLTRSQRRATVHALKHERDQAILDAKRNYYKTKP
jgi:hypothetical protein